MTFYLTEGELKAIAACEAGIPAVGIGGLTSAVVGGQLVPGLQQLLAEWPIDRLVLVGDADVGLIDSFSRTAVALARTVPDGVEVGVIAPGLHAPAKGLDDQRATLGEGFMAYWETLVALIVSVPREMGFEELALTLLRREQPGKLRAIYRCENEHDQT